MNVRVKIELLAPSVQDTEETDLRTEMFGIASNFVGGWGGGMRATHVGVRT